MHFLWRLDGAITINMICSVQCSIQFYGLTQCKAPGHDVGGTAHIADPGSAPRDPPADRPQCTAAARCPATLAAMDAPTSPPLRARCRQAQHSSRNSSHSTNANQVCKAFRVCISSGWLILDRCVLRMVHVQYLNHCSPGWHDVERASTATNTFK